MVDRLAFERAVAERSPLSPAKVEAICGPASPETRAAIWGFINLTARQQMFVADAHGKLLAFGPPVQVTNVRIR